ncbi:MAG: hypothetical protein WC824_02900 [Bacteroidota bacterium]
MKRVVTVSLLLLAILLGVSPIYAQGLQSSVSHFARSMGPYDLFRTHRPMFSDSRQFESRFGIGQAGQFDPLRNQSGRRFSEFEPLLSIKDLATELLRRNPEPHLLFQEENLPTFSGYDYKFPGDGMIQRILNRDAKLDMLGVASFESAFRPIVPNVDLFTTSIHDLLIVKPQVPLLFDRSRVFPVQFELNKGELRRMEPVRKDQQLGGWMWRQRDDSEFRVTSPRWRVPELNLFMIHPIPTAISPGGGDGDGSQPSLPFLNDDDREARRRARALRIDPCYENRKLGIPCP